MRKFLLRAAAWVTTFGFIAGIVAAVVAVFYSVVAAYFGWAGNFALFFAWAAVAAGAYVAATAGAYVAATVLTVIAAVLCVVLKFSTDIEPIY